jgi:putative ABC transport system ATP-binding protein
MLLEIKNVSLGFNGKTLVSNASLALNPGDLVIIGGPSGGGKSSFLRILNRLRDPDSGVMLLDGKPFSSYKVVELRRRICYLHQTPQIIEGTVRDNLLLPFTFRSSQKSPRPDDSRLRILLDRFKLAEVSFADDATKLSVGQKQRLAFVRTLLLKPDLLLLDEPTSALDPESRMVVEEMIEELAGDEKVGIVMVTHLDFEPKRMAARKYRLSDGALREVPL